MTIREDVKGRILLTGLRQVTINSIEDLLSALNFGSSIRQTDATAINAQSSRSHAVFSINLVQRRNRPQPAGRDKRMSMPVEALSSSEDTVTMDSKLHFVDLAGSERLKNTGASGDRAKEGISINAGLASLGKVISQLSTRNSGTYVSYRDSKLTRLLQDSLGGNAITYMIACVTPAEFHLSETLNTVQYAQRARAIQSRPQLQQISDDGDKQAVIERLRAEVSFLRGQIRSSERGLQVPMERSDRQSEREMELQNHLLDIQENYTALSQRHAKLIAEIAKARDDEEGGSPTLSETIGESAIDRLKRSNSFAEAVEQVVLEYEKTIQSLETSLSNTRSSLATTESSLLEKENRCAYMETVNQQLQQRFQKLADREVSNEQYLHTLEARLDGQTSGDEKSTALVMELRKEVSRVRENEAQAEDYISTLEERLAEADQDLELKQRDLDRLEHVVERQRSLGKLDNLLYEFDHLQQNGHLEEPVISNGIPNGVGHVVKKHRQQKSILEEAAGVALPESDDEFEDAVSEQKTNVPAILEPRDTSEQEILRTNEVAPIEVSRMTGKKGKIQTSKESNQLAQVTQELFDLRLQHRSTVCEFDMMTAKYEEALRTLAELQDAIDIARHPEHSQLPHSPVSPRPTSLVGDSRINEIKDGEQVPSSRSLSSELSLAGDSSTSVEPSMDDHLQSQPMPGEFQESFSEDNAYVKEAEELKKIKNEQDQELKAANERYSQLHELHNETLDIVEELKAEVQKAKLNNPASSSSPVIRRKSSQNVMTIDRAHRSFASLRNIAAENLENQPDTMQSFELNLNTAMHELHQRSERVQLLEAELAAVKKDMDSKTQIITGLTRERSSLKQSSPIMDMSVMSTLNDQLLQRESQMRQLQERHDTREHELTIEIDALKQTLDDLETSKSRVSSEPDRKLEKQPSKDAESTRLRTELSSWQDKYKSTVESMETTEKRLLSTISELEQSLTAVENLKDQAEEKADGSVRRSVADADFEAERQHYLRTVEGLQEEIIAHKATIGSHVDRVTKLEQLHNSTQAQIDEAERSRSANESSLESYRQQVSHLEQQIQEHQSAVEFHKHGLKSLHDSHSKEIGDLRNQIEEYESAKAEMERNMKTMQDAHTGHLTRLESEVIDFRTQVEKSKAEFTEQLHHSKSAVTETERQRDQLQAQISTIKSEMNKAARLNEANLKKMDEMKRERDRATSLVDQLEEQLNASYEQQRVSSSRLSMLNNSTGGHAQAVLEEKSNLEKQLRDCQVQIESLRVSLLRQHLSPLLIPNQSQLPDSQQSLERSCSSLRKSTSVTSLPSPPPAIPLPPLPANAIASPTSATFPSTGPNLPPTSDSKLQKELDNLSSALSDRENHMRQMEKHLIAEKQLTRTLEEALADLENGQKRNRADVDAWKKKCWALEDEVGKLKREGAGREKERERERWSVQAMEEEKRKRGEAERARAELEERMRGLERAGKKKKKGGGLNCF